MSRARGLGVPGTDTTRTPRNPAPSARRPAGGPLTRPASLLLRGQAPGAVGFLPWRDPQDGRSGCVSNLGDYRPAVWDSRESTWTMDGDLIG